MWNKLAEIMQAPASKRLGIAIVVSALLHTLFFGNVDFSLPSLKKEMHLIEARIQMPKAVPLPAPEPIAEPLPEVAPTEETALPQPEAIVEAPPEPSIDAPSEPVAETPVENVVEAAPVQPPDIPNKSVDISDPLPTTASDPVQEPQPEDIGLVINENAYQYIETEFDVRTKIDGSTEGNAKITYKLIEGNQYHIKWLTEGRGLAALLFPDLLQVSEGALTKTGLRPNQYIYQFGNKADKSRSAAFDWPAKKVSLQTSKGTKIEDLPDGTQDLLSFMYQFMHVAPLQHMQLPIVNGKKLRIYDYSFEGEEQVNSDLGELKTIHILHSGNEDETTELWLAIDYQYVPVKIRKIENDGKVVEMVATRITTNRPVINQ
jgi:Protein of unknown function (DUF3108)